MFAYQTVIVIGISGLYGYLVFLFCRRFIKGFSLPAILIFPVLIFSAGYIFRLSGIKPMIDTGYFLTDSASIFLSTLFAGALILGQLKFWKK